VSLSEAPFLVLDIVDIEVAHFERVQYMTKNFDLVLIYKDYQTFKRISAIPMEYLDTIKSWLDATNILFSEGPISLNWPNILNHIREDFEGFVEDGSWVFLRDNITEEDNTHGQRGEGGGSEPESDSEYNESEDAEEDGSESDFSDEDGESEESDAESSDV
jgi:nucleosome binding factor SPN SPT16 subunit